MNEAHSRKKILLLGDSITQQSFSPLHRGFGAGISDWYHRTADVVARGFSGYNSRWIRSMLPRLLPKGQQYEGYVACTVFLGANDSVFPEHGQHVPLDEYKANLEAIVEHIHALNAEMAIILVTPPVVCSNQWPSRSIENVKRYADTVRQICKEKNYVDLLDLYQSCNGLEPIVISDLRDGLHFGECGNNKFLMHFQHLIRSKHYNICPDDDTTTGQPNMELQYPHFSAIIDNPNYESLLQNWNYEN